MDRWCTYPLGLYARINVIKNKCSASATFLVLVAISECAKLIIHQMGQTYFKIHLGRYSDTQPSSYLKKKEEGLS